MSHLIIREGGSKRQIALSQHTRIGRVIDNDIYFNDENISRHHAEITRTEDGYLFTDLNSCNGTLLHGRRISEKLLSHGDTLTLGSDITLTFIDKLSEIYQENSVQITSNPISVKAIQDRLKIGDEDAFLPADQITDDVDWREDYEKLRLGNELLMQHGIQYDLNDNIESIAHKLLEIFPADRCAVLLIDSKTDKLFPMTVQLQRGVKGPLSISRSIAEEVRNTHSALLVADVRNDERFSISHSLLLQEVQTVLCAPLIYDNNFYGIIHLDSLKDAMVFNRRDLHLLTSLSTHIATVIANTKLIQSIEKDVRDKTQLARLLPPSIIQKIKSGEIKLDTEAGQLKEVTILFADICGFTNMAQNASAAKTVALLNEYFELIVSVVFQYGGTVDKLIGDEVMVLFGALTDVKFAEDRAIRCAFMMHGVLELLNKKRIAKGEEPIEISIGINTGVVVVGAIGSSQAMQYTCIGNAVNIASRLTSAAKAKETIISEETFNRLTQKPKFRMLPPMTLKGIETAVQLYAVWEDTTETTQHFTAS